MSLSTISNSESGSSVRSKINAAFGVIDALIPTGFIMHSMINVAYPGWVRAHGGSIGSATSGATERANADTQELYQLLWDNVDNAYCPVAGGRGASGAADFSMGKAMTLPDLRGQVMVARHPPGAAFSAVVGSSLGTEAHTLTESELPVVATHSHSVPTGSSSISVTPDPAGVFVSDISVTTTGAGGGFGSGSAHNNIQPSRIVGAVYLKL